MPETNPVRSEYMLYKLVQKTHKFNLPTIWKGHTSYAGFRISFSGRQLFVFGMDGETHWFQYARMNWETKYYINHFIAVSIITELIKESEDKEIHRLLRKFKIDKCRDLPDNDVRIIEDLVTELMAVDQDDVDAVRNVYLKILKVKDVSVWKQIKQKAITTVQWLKTRRCL